MPPYLACVFVPVSGLKVGCGERSEPHRSRMDNASIDAVRTSPHPTRCNALGKTPGLDYIGILARALPRLVQVTPDNISPRENGEEPHPGILAEVDVAGEPSLILDLDSIEAKLIELLELED
mgnify:CR=1 FL=1